MPSSFLTRLTPEEREALRTAAQGLTAVPCLVCGRPLEEDGACLDCDLNPPTDSDEPPNEDWGQP